MQKNNFDSLYLNFDYVLSIFSEIKELSFTYRNNGCNLLYPPELVHSSSRFQALHLYVTEDRFPAFSDDNRKALLIFVGNPSSNFTKQLINSGCSYIIIQPSPHITLEYVFNLLQTQYIQFCTWENTLYHSLTFDDFHNALYNLLKESIPIFHNSLILFNRKLSVLTSISADESPIFDSGETQIQELKAIITHIKQNRFLSGITTMEHKDGTVSAFHHLFYRENYLGTICIYKSTRPLTSTDSVLLRKLGKWIQYVLQLSSYLYDDILLADTLLKNIFSGKHIEKSELSRLTERLSYTEDDSYICYTFALPSNAAPNYNDAIVSSLKNWLTKNTIVFIHDNLIVLVLNIDYCQRQNIPYETYIPSLVEAWLLKGGISRPFKGLENSSTAYNEARSTLRMLLATESATSLLDFDVSRMDIILNNCIADAPPDIFYPEGFKMLLEHDADNNISFLETLRIYLENDRNSSVAAKLLFISRTSFIARLKRIMDLIPESLEIPKVRVQYMLAFLLHDKYQTKK